MADVVKDPSLKEVQVFVSEIVQIFKEVTIELEEGSNGTPNERKVSVEVGVKFKPLEISVKISW